MWVPKADALRDIYDALLSIFQLEQNRDDVVKNISKGVKQKLTIVLSLIADPDPILLNEPTLRLDVHSVKLVLGSGDLVILLVNSALYIAVGLISFMYLERIARHKGLLRGILIFHGQG